MSEELLSELRDLERRIGPARLPMDIRSNLHQIIVKYERRCLGSVMVPSPQCPNCISGRKTVSQDGSLRCDQCEWKEVRPPTPPEQPPAVDDLVPLNTIIEPDMEWEHPISKKWYPVEPHTVGLPYVRDEVRVRRRRVSPTYRAFASAEEAKVLIDRLLRGKRDTDWRFAKASALDGRGCILGDEFVSWEQLFTEYVFDDDGSPCGTPCGIATPQSEATSIFECEHCGTPDILPSGRCAHCNLPDRRRLPASEGDK